MDYLATNLPEATNLLADISNPYFGIEGHDLYNGNIHLMITPMNTIDELGSAVLANQYRYDQLQRIKSSNVYEDVPEPETKTTKNELTGSNIIDVAAF